MKKSDINNAITGYLSDGFPGEDISFPNVDDNHTAPYLHVFFGSAARGATRLRGGKPQREVGVFTVNVHIETSANGGETEANDMAERVADMFAAGTKISLGSALVTIIKPPDVRGGVPTDVDWFVPVIVTYAAVPL